jgi:DNA-binding XRE family transcriptional regulator
MKNTLKVQRAILDLTQEDLAKKMGFHVKQSIQLKRTGMFRPLF